MDPDEQREVYELTRRAVRHELRAIIHDFFATVIGTALFVIGATTVIGALFGDSSFWPLGIVGLVIGGLGLSMVAITYKWDRWLRRHLPVGGTTQK